MKVLMSAYSCRPGQGSEPGAGWAWVHAATRDHDVWLITHTANAAAIESMRRADHQLAQRLHPTYVHLGRGMEPLRRSGPLRFVYYVIWQLLACRRAARRLLGSSQQFDVCHHLTYAADWAPCGLTGLGVPFVWGPVGGSSTPAAVRVWPVLGLRIALAEIARLVALSLLRHAAGRAVARRASVVLAQNAHVAQVFPTAPVVVEPNVAIEADRAVSGRSAADRPVLRQAIFAGRLLGWKGPTLAVLALSHPEAAGWHLDIYGDGPQRSGLERLVRRRGLQHRVRLLGRRPRSEVAAALSTADVMLLPSIHDAAGWAVAEALAAGCPVVGVRLAGPVTLVGPEDGILVEPDRHVVGRLALALGPASALRPRRDRWQAGRLPYVLDATYRRAVGRIAQDAAELPA